MPETPVGLPVPPTGPVDAALAARSRDRPLGVYVHVPFCRVRCGYCDFNTYLPGAAGVEPADYADLVCREIRLAREIVGPRPLVETVFFGGGTPTLLPAADLVTILGVVAACFGLAPNAEVTVEANPDTVTAESAAQLAAGGVTRLSLGMQSAVPHVLATLDRTHHPDNVERALGAARAAGLVTSLDLIYGTPGESLADWEISLTAAVAAVPDHISAYALVVEDGTRMASMVRRGELPPPDDDDEADKYELADRVLGAAGYEWYEISNWSRTAQGACRHNIAYWCGHDWWGAGPGAHSHVDGVRFWNAKHPAAYRDRLASQGTAAVGMEVVDGDRRYVERVLLESRLSRGVALSVLRPAGCEAVPQLVDDGLAHVVEGPGGPHLVLTLRGRLLADTVVHHLTRGC